MSTLSKISIDDFNIKYPPSDALIEDTMNNNETSTKNARKEKLFQHRNSCKQQKFRENLPEFHS